MEQSKTLNERFTDLADLVSASQGTWQNILVWLLLICTWCMIFAWGNPVMQSGEWLPKWFISTGFNFPLNLITTVFELFLAFLNLASCTRVERRNAELNEKMLQILEHLETLSEKEETELEVLLNK